jgi:hypothetical protein
VKDQIAEAASNAWYVDGADDETNGDRCAGHDGVGVDHLHPTAPGRDATSGCECAQCGEDEEA